MKALLIGLTIGVIAVALGFTFWLVLGVIVLFLIAGTLFVWEECVE